MWSLGLLLLASPAYADRAVGILAFEAGPADPQYQGLGTALAGMVTTDLVTVPGLVVVERQRIADVLAELKLAESGFLDPATVVQVGKGIGAELWLQGRFSVVQERFFLDLQLLSVATGATVTAAQADGPIGEWVSVEKQVVEKLADGLDVDLEVAVRRKLLDQTPTTDLVALASYGRGVEAADDQRWDEARINYEAAMRLDPSFALAGRALAGLKLQVEQGLLREEAIRGDAQYRALAGALQQLPSELDRPASFRDTRDTEVELAVRWSVMHRLKLSCQILAEMQHYFERRQGKWTAWTDALKGKDPLARSELARELLDARGTALGVVGPNGPFLRGDLFHDSVQLLGSPRGMLATSMMPERMHGLAGQVERCVPREAQETAWSDVIGLSDRFGLSDQPAWTVHGEGPSPITIGVVVRLYSAFVHARAFGGDEDVVRMTEAELGRYPEGAPGRFEVLNRIKGIVTAGEEHDRRLVARLGMPDEALVGGVRALAAEPKSPTSAPLCGGLGKLLLPQAQALAVQFDTDGASAVELDRAGDLVAVMQIAGCLPGQAPRTKDQILAYLEESTGRPHPRALSAPECKTQLDAFRTQLATVRGLPASFTEDMYAPTLYGVIDAVHRQRRMLCLVP